MSVRSQFVSNANKELLWGVLFENSVFSGVHPDQYSSVQTCFEDLIAKQAASIGAGESLVDANKTLVSSMVGAVGRFKTPVQPVAPSTPGVKETDLDAFNRKKADLESAMKVTAPEGVSFADDADTPIDGTVLDSLLEDTLKQRQQDMDAASRLHEPPPGAPKGGKRVAWADQQGVAAAGDTEISHGLREKLKPALVTNNALAATLARLETKIDDITKRLDSLESRPVLSQ